jgi:hypothetical protein
MATKDTPPAVMLTAAPRPARPGLALAPVSSLTCQPACHLPGHGSADGHGRAQPCWTRPGLDLD